MTGLALFGLVGIGVSLGGAGPTLGAFVGSYVAGLTRDAKWARPFARRLARLERASGLDSDAVTDAAGDASEVR